MKVLFDFCSLSGYSDDSNVKFGVGWYRHSKNHKWWGLTVEFYGFGRMFSITYVDNSVEYYKLIRRRHYSKKKDV